MFECFGEEALKTYGRRIIISSGGLIGNRDAILSWSHHMTLVRSLSTLMYRVITHTESSNPTN